MKKQPMETSSAKARKRSAKRASPKRLKISQETRDAYLPRRNDVHDLVAVRRTVHENDQQQYQTARLPDKTQEGEARRPG